MAQDLSPAAAEHATSQGRGKKRQPMKDTPADQDVADKAWRVTADELRGFIERMEQLGAEKAEVADQEKEVMASAKARGYDTKTIRKLLRLRRLSADELAEADALLDMYRGALGM